MWAGISERSMRDDYTLVPVTPDIDTAFGSGRVPAVSS